MNGEISEGDMDADEVMFECEEKMEKTITFLRD